MLMKFRSTQQPTLARLAAAASITTCAAASDMALQTRSELYMACISFQQAQCYLGAGCKLMKQHETR